MKKIPARKNKGFTLIELLVVIAIIAILAAVVFVALDPATRFADARNSRRWSDVNTVLTAVHECVVDNGGDFDGCGLVDNDVHILGTGTGNLNLSTNLSKYLISIPVDPSGTAANTGYTIELNANNIVTVKAANAENSAVVQVSR